MMNSRIRPCRSKKTIFFATDFHGSTICFRKFISASNAYGADYLFMGGDYCSKDLWLYVETAGGIEAMSTDKNRKLFRNSAEFEEFRSSGVKHGAMFAPAPSPLDDITRTQYVGVFKAAMEKRIHEWAAYARNKIGDCPIFVIPGNDDEPALDHLFQERPFVWVHRRHHPIDEAWSVLGWGGSNPTPWHTIRETPDDVIDTQIRVSVDPGYLSSRTILLVHPPPFGSGLDAAPEIDKTFRLRLGAGGARTVNVGSHAVRRFVEEFQPPIALFGHIHEARGRVSLGRSICVNPGSAYASGTLLGVLVDFDSTSIRNVSFTEG